MPTHPVRIARPLALLAGAGLALAFSLAPAPAPAAAARATTGARAQDSDAQGGADRRRLLALESGRVLRERSRQVDGRWEVRRGRDWVPLEEGVVRARLEKEVLAEARALADQVGRDDHAQRVTLVRWMLAQGLHSEAVVELNRVLGDDPEHPGALELVRTEFIELDLPDEADEGPAAELKALIKYGATAAPAGREIATQRLAELGERVDLRKLTQAELTTPQPTRRAFATHVARRLFPGEFLRELSSRMILDGSRTVREGAAGALRAADDVAVLGPPINALASASANVRINAIDALGNLGHAAAVEPLVSHLAALQAGGAPTGTRASMFIGFQTAYVMDYDVEIAQAASIADPIVSVQASGIVFDVRTTVQMTREIELRTLVANLQKLTGASPGPTPRHWAEWWEENKGVWRSMDRAQPETRR